MAGTVDTPSNALSPMSDRELISLCEQYKERALNRDEEEVSNERQRAYDYYRMEPYGDEQEGYSQAVTGEVLETVEWAMPSLVRSFLVGTPTPFRPMGADDVQAAEQESEAVAWVITQANESFSEVSQWFRDGLLYPNGYLKVWWDERENYRFAEYEGLLPEQVAALEVQGEQIVTAEMSEDGTYRIAIRQSERVSQICIKATPPEEVLVDGHATTLDLDEVNFVAHRPSRMTRSDLVAMGYDLDLVLGLEQWDGDLSSLEKTARRDSVDEQSGLFTPTGDQMMEQVEYVEAYLRVDADGDGYAEYRKVCYSGSTMLENTYTDTQPFCAITSIIQSHRHLGWGLGQTAMTIQRENSALKRQTLDNLYRITRPRAILGRSINRDEWDNYQPHGGVEGDPGDYQPEQTPVAVQHVLPFLQYQDDELQSRTGVSKHSMGLDSEQLAESTLGAYLEASGNSSQRLEMLIRTFAEVGWSKLVRKVHALLRKHQDVPLQVQISGEWTMVAPTVWRDRTQLQCAIGTGSGSQRERAAAAVQILGLQKEALATGLTTPDRIYNTLDELVKLLGRSGAERYFVDPESPEGQQIAAQMAQQAQQQQAQQAAQMGAVLETERDSLRQKHMQHLDELQFDYDKLEVEQGVDIPGKGTPRAQ